MHLKRQIISIIVAIKRAAGDMTSTSVIKQGNTLIAMGETKQLEALERLVRA